MLGGYIPPSPGVYAHVVSDNISKTYRKADPGTVTQIEIESHNIAEKLNIGDRINRPAPKQAFVTIKDHKQNFQTNTKCRLINPTKPEMGCVSKAILDRINNTIRSRIRVNQWRNTSSVLKWFTNLDKKNNLTFLVFDIVDFYPSISEELLSKCLLWAKRYASISNTEHSAILYDHKGNTWEKRKTHTHTHTHPHTTSLTSPWALMTEQSRGL
ncbi:hypothetical protein HOLleu_09120 [Holothuria leucospilota]|uniref:Uncharacterized protein n=1 Tax=Holothuria leucospilota TaxID=206669 RepID=A0A9Q1CJA5_HOLLE|nr:hypothetical protein HOLleu_09120 [Holothuria leucospilota]